MNETVGLPSGLSRSSTFSCDDDGGAFGGVSNIADHIAAGDGFARFADLFVAADMIGMQVSIDDVADWLGAARRSRSRALQLADGGENLVAHFSESGIHQQNAVGPIDTVMFPPAPASM